jgi:Tol biopolymer transport system component
VGIYRLSVQTGDVTPIVQSIEGYGVSVEWHPDGKSIIYVRSDNTSDLVHILRRELEGGAEKEIYSFPAPQNLEIAVSPDGRWLSSKITVSKTERIFRILALSGGVSRDLVRGKTEDGSLPYRHAWSADGKYILFSRKRVNELTWDLWRVSIEGGAEPQKLDVSMPWVIDHLTAHPDNRTFAFTSGRSSVADSGIWVMENLSLFAK